ncbi:MAG: caa(3)-type oxidase subunit IV [Planctomycetota bacterium]|jgi:caa(3)-type oxidase subunit IV
MSDQTQSDHAQPDQATGDSHAQGELQMGHTHVSSPVMFMTVLIALLFLTFITVAVAQFNFGSANMLIAMAIASVKATLVMAFFMHLKWDTAVNKLMFLSSFLFLALLFIFTLADQFTRRLDGELHTTTSPVDKSWVQPVKRDGPH